MLDVVGEHNSPLFNEPPRAWVLRIWVAAFTDSRKQGNYQQAEEVMETCSE